MKYEPLNELKGAAVLGILVAGEKVIFYNFRLLQHSFPIAYSIYNKKNLTKPNICIYIVRNTDKLVAS